MCPCEVRPGVRSAGLPRQSRALTPDHRRRLRRRLDLIRLNSAADRQIGTHGRAGTLRYRPAQLANGEAATVPPWCTHQWGYQ
jgi:hypothetical protein